MKRFIFTNCAMVHNELFLVGMMGGLLAKMSPNSGKIRYYDIMKGFVVKEAYDVVDFLDFYQNKVYALDAQEDNLAIFDLEKYQCQYIPLGCSHQPWLNFVAFERYESNYYIFSKYESKILVFDIENNRMREISGYLMDIDEIQCACRVRNSVWILPKDADVIYCYDLRNGENEVYELKRCIKNCVHAVFDSGYIYILNIYGIIYIWDIDKRVLKEIADLETQHNENESMSRIIHAGNRLILLPALGNDIRILDLLTGKTELYDDYPKDFIFEPEAYKFYGYCEDERYYFFAMCFGNYFLKIEKQSGRLIWVKLFWDSPIELYRKAGRNLFCEGEWEIKDLLRVEKISNQQTYECCVGEKIYWQ